MSNRIFQSVKGAKVRKSAFDLSHERKLSCEMGQLVPILVQETVPGDKWMIKSDLMIRVAPMLAPIMHRIDAYIHYFYVPNRIVWSGWEDFITNEEEDVVPHSGTNHFNVVEGGLADHMGLPTGNYVDSLETINMLPFYAYWKIWNEYYRDQNLQDEVDNAVGVTKINTLLHRNYEKDYFTSCLPWAQKGGAVELPISNTVTYNDPTRIIDDVTESYLKATDDADLSNRYLYPDSSTPVGDQDVIIDNIDSVDGTIDINDLRTATRLQRWLERNARAGTRYVEQLLAHWGVRSSDQRLNRPEYLGGGKTPIVISEVLNTNGATVNNEDLGTMAGHGITVGGTNFAKKYTEEHGYIIGLLSIMPKTAYMQGMPKHFTRRTNLDFYWPEFSQLGEQEVKLKELFMTTDGNDNDQLFGYQSRYAEYKNIQSSVHGDFRTTLNHWHMTRELGSEPTLNSDFIKCDPSRDGINRIFPVESGEHFWCQVYHKITAVRPMPFHNNPTL